MTSSRHLRAFTRATAALALLAAFCLPFLADEKPPPPKPLDLNSATAEQLEKLPGIGPVTAQAILRFREKSGPFRRVEDLLAIRGINKKKLEKLRPLVTVSPPPPPTPKT